MQRVDAMSERQDAIVEMSQPALIEVSAVPAQPWRNGGGRTRELLTRPSGAQNWCLRISVAEVDREGPFSSFPGIHRWFCVLDGAGVHLGIDGAERRLTAMDGPIEFSGEAPVSCRLIDGPTRDLNLMHAGGTGLMQPVCDAQPWRSQAAQRGLFTRVAGRWRAGDAAPIEVPAFALLWFDAAGTAPWTFNPGTAAPGPPALWLAWDPASAPSGNGSRE